MTDQKKAIEAELEAHISAGRIHPRWRSILPEIDRSPEWAKSLRVKLDNADRARDGVEIIVDAPYRQDFSDWRRFVGRAQRQAMSADPAPAVAIGAAVHAAMTEAVEKGFIPADWLAGDVHVGVDWGSGQSVAVSITLPGAIQSVAVKGTISLCEPRCECGSGNHLRGPGHSDYCQLWEVK